MSTHLYTVTFKQEFVHRYETNKYSQEGYHDFFDGRNDEFG